MNSLSVFRLTTPSFLRILLYNCKNSELVILCFVRLYFICGSGKVIQISSTSFSAKIWLINSIWVRIKATLCKPVSKAVLAPRQKRAPLISIPTKFLLGYLSAKPTEYSPFPQPSSSTSGFSFLKKSEFHFPLSGNKSPTTSSLVGWKTLLNV